MSYFHKFVEFSKTMFTILQKNYLSLLQQIANLLKKIGLLGTLLKKYLIVMLDAFLLQHNAFKRNLLWKKILWAMRYYCKLANSSTDNK